MSTRSSARNLFPPLENPELTIQRRSRSDPTLLNNSEMAAEGHGDLPVPDLRTMKELCQPSLNGRGGPIPPIAIHATNFGLKNDMIQQSIKVNGVTDDALRLYLFPHSLTHHATAWFNRGNFMKRHPEECYDLIENITAHHNDWDTSTQQNESSSSITSSSDTEITSLKAKMNKNLMRVLQVNQQVKAVTPNCETCGGPHSFSDCLATVGNTQNVYAVGAYQGIKEIIILRGTTREETNSSKELTKIPQPQVLTTNEFINFIKANDAILKNLQTNITSLRNSNRELKNMFGQFMKMNTASSSGSRTLAGNTITNPKEDLKGITTRRGTAYPGPTIPTNSSSPVVERETEVTKDTMYPTNNKITEDVQPLVVSTESLILNSELVVSLIIEHVASPKLRDKANDQREKFFQIFKDLNFNISFVDALILMPKFVPSIKSLLTNKDKLCELARTLLNEHCLAILLKKFPEKLGDPGKFLIPCDFPRMAECLALAYLDASINLMPMFVWNKLSLLDLSPMCMTLELTDGSISRPVGVAEDVYVKVGTFHLLVDFGVVDFDADPRVPLILGRSFLKIRRALIDVFEANYSDITANLIDVIGMACDEYSQEVLGFSYVIASGNPTLYYDLIVSTTSLTLTPFGNSDFLLEEVDAFLALEDDPTLPEVNQSYLDSEGYILLLEAFLNDDPSLPPLNQGNYLPAVCKELKIFEAKYDKSLIDEPPEVELKYLPPHLEYAFLKGDDKFLVIIVKDLNVEEKTALIMVLKSCKRAIAWKLFDIKGIDPEFCTHKILMEEDFEPAVQHQRRVNPKIHDVIKQEVLKLLDAGLIYPISDSPWVSAVHCVPKKGGFTVVKSEENELILTRLVTGWCLCIDYHKLNEATRKDHFPLPFMDQMLERLTGNQYYCFLDSFFGYFQIPIDPKDQEKTTFTCPYGTFAYRCMPLGLCNASGRFQRCLMAIFHDMIGKTMDVFMDDFLVFGNSFQTCLSHLEKMLKRCEDTNLCLNWEKSYFMVKEGIVIVHKISKKGIEVDKAKVDVNTKLPHPISVKEGVYTARKSLTFSRLAIMDPPRDTMAQITQPGRFRTPRAIISDRETHFCNDQFAKVMQKFGVTHRLATPYHPQTSGQVEVSNRGLKHIIERTVRENHAFWSNKLDDALWEFLTAYKTPIGCTLYKLVYGKACHLPIELEHKAYWALKHANFDLQTAGDHRKV
nr:reverse transcriptase domain-containing protein [Tanacetum cinerariifolium]